MKLYACGSDWQLEIGNADTVQGRMPLYSSIEELKAFRTCWEECGIVVLELTEAEWAVAQNFMKEGV
jgi:hypothetical protein